MYCPRTSPSDAFYPKEKSFLQGLVPHRVTQSSLCLLFVTRVLAFSGSVVGWGGVGGSWGAWMTHVWGVIFAFLHLSTALPPISAILKNHVCDL